MTYGWLVGEVLARITGLTPGELLRKEIAEPLGVDSSSACRKRSWTG
jgi:CubicO group peptidase (beta-lactamase class C family)